MKIQRDDEQTLSEWLVQYGVPTAAWAVLFAFFAISGWVSSDEPKQIALAAPAVELLADDATSSPPRVPSERSASDPELRDEAVVAHEALDPVGTGRYGN